MRGSTVMVCQQFPHIRTLVSGIYVSKQHSQIFFIHGIFSGSKQNVYNIMLTLMRLIM